MGYFDPFYYQGILCSSYPHQSQDFEYFAILDFEATCDKGKILQPQEIIEEVFLCRKSSSAGEVVESFSLETEDI